MILGFGKTEEQFRQQEFDVVREFLKSKATGVPRFDFKFTDEIVRELKELLIERAKEYENLYQEYKVAENPPERYSTFSFRVLNDWCDICVIYKFIHINRRHPMSPDGWGAIYQTEIFHADYFDYQNDK